MTELSFLPGARLSGPTPWVIAIMTLLALVGTAGGLALTGASRELGSAAAHSFIVQVVHADAEVATEQADRAEALLKRLSGVAHVRRVPDGELRAALGPYLGQLEAADAVPVPPVIEGELAGATAATLAQALVPVAPAARVEQLRDQLAPLKQLVDTLARVAALAVALVAAATVSAVVLAVRGSFDTHRGTVELLHLMGATDAQIARQFQARVARDAAAGAALGLVLGGIVIFLLRQQLVAAGAALTQVRALQPLDWLILLAVPVLAVVIALAVARLTALAQLARLT